MVKAKQTGRAVSIPNGLFTGVICAFAVTLVGCIITAKLVDAEIMNQNRIGYAIMVILIAASWIDGMVAYQRVKRQKLMVCMLSGICFYGLLLIITILFFGGQYSGAGETSLLIMCGSLLSVFLKSNTGTGRKVQKIKIKNR